MIDCPPTPEILLNSSTPPSSSLLDMLESSSSAEELDNCSASAGDGSMESGRSSPPPKCAICLGKCRQKCYTDSCRHQFCYHCLLEWSKVIFVFFLLFIIIDVVQYDLFCFWFRLKRSVHFVSRCSVL